MDDAYDRPAADLTDCESLVPSESIDAGTCGGRTIGVFCVVLPPPGLLPASSQRTRGSETVAGDSGARRIPPRLIAASLPPFATAVTVATPPPAAPKRGVWSKPDCSDEGVMLSPDDDGAGKWVASYTNCEPLSS